MYSVLDPNHYLLRVATKQGWPSVCLAKLMNVIYAIVSFTLNAG